MSLAGLAVGSLLMNDCGTYLALAEMHTDFYLSMFSCVAYETLVTMLDNLCSIFSGTVVYILTSVQMLMRARMFSSEYRAKREVPSRVAQHDEVAV